MFPAVTVNWYSQSRHQSSFALVSRRTTLPVLQRGHSGLLGQRSRSSSSRHFSSVPNRSTTSGRVIVSTPTEKEKKEALRRVPTRKLLASIKRDLRRQLQSAP